MILERLFGISPPRIAALALLTIAAAACGATAAPVATTGSDQSDIANGPETTTNDGGKVGTDAAGKETTAGTYDEDFWIVYNHNERVPQQGKPPSSDLVLTNWKNPQVTGNNSKFGIGVSPFDAIKSAVEMTKDSFAKLDAGYSCNFGCSISPNLHYVALALAAPTASGYSYALGLLSGETQDLVYIFKKFGVLEKVTDLHFAADYLYYSTPVACGGTGVCQYDIHRRGPLSGASEDIVVTKMVPDNDPDLKSDTTYKGHFQVSEDGSTLVFLTTTIRSVKVYAWREGNVSKLDYICEHPLGADTCVGQGSQYHDNDRVGISPDGKIVILFTIVDNNLRVRRYNVGSEVANTFSNLVSVPNGQEYLAGVCKVLDPSKPQLAEVKQQPQFSADGKLLYFLAYAVCPKGSLNKPWTDIMALPVDKIGGPIVDSDWINFTNNPRDNNPANKRIFDFALSPSKQALVLSATASIQQSGAAIPEATPPADRSLKDSEIYVLPLGDTKWQSVTNQLSYDAFTPMTVVPFAKK